MNFKGEGAYVIFHIYGESYSRWREKHELLGDTSRFDPQYAPFFYSGFESNYKNIILEFFEVFQVAKTRFPMIKWGSFHITFKFVVW